LRAGPLRPGSGGPDPPVTRVGSSLSSRSPRTPTPCAVPPSRSPGCVRVPDPAASLPGSILSRAGPTTGSAPRPSTLAAYREEDESRVAEQDEDPLIAAAVLEFAWPWRTALALSSARCTRRCNPGPPPGWAAALTSSLMAIVVQPQRPGLDVRVLQRGQAPWVGGRRARPQRTNVGGSLLADDGSSSGPAFRPLRTHRHRALARASLGS